MTKPHRGTSDSPSPEGVSSVGIAMDSLHHMMIEQFEKLEDEIAIKILSVI